MKTILTIHHDLTMIISKCINDVILIFFPFFFFYIRQGKNGEKATRKVNLAHEYDRNFHTTFITIAAASILFILAVFIISVSMWNIDPGRDSIIYRLTAQKIKKDQ